MAVYLEDLDWAGRRMIALGWLMAELRVCRFPAASACSRAGLSLERNGYTGIPQDASASHFSYGVVYASRWLLDPSLRRPACAYGHWTRWLHARTRTSLEYFSRTGTTSTGTAFLTHEPTWAFLALRFLDFQLRGRVRDFVRGPHRPCDLDVYYARKTLYNHACLVIETRNQQEPGIVVLPLDSLCRRGFCSTATRHHSNQNKHLRKSRPTSYCASIDAVRRTMRCGPPSPWQYLSH